MSLADALLADLDGLSDDEAPRSPSPEPSTASAQPAASSSKGAMLPPPLPMKAMSAASNGAGSSSALVNANGKRPVGAEGDAGQKNDDDDMDDAMLGPDGQPVSLGFVPEGGVRPAEELDAEEVSKSDMTVVDNVAKVSKLLSGRRLKEILEGIDKYTAAPTDMSAAGGSLEENPEYTLVVAANNMSVEVDNEILLVHKFVRDHYAPRFPELEQLISDPWTYLAAVKGIRNAPDLTKAALPDTLTSATKLSITLTATSSRGRLLSDEEWSTVEAAITVAEDLRKARETIFAYVESRMAAVAPNVSAIVGTGIAAKLLGIAGGLQALTRQPACNIMVFGAAKKSLSNAHLSAASQQRHTGFIFQSQVVQSAQPEDRRKTQRIVSGKLVLAARTDEAKGARDGSYGRKLLVDIQKRIVKMAEPPPNKITKALPIPQETNRKKRGGKQAKRAKEAYAQTQLRKLQNRMEFGKAEEEMGVDDETVGLGMIGSSSGRVRGETADAKSKAKLSRANKLRTQLLGRSLVSSDAKSGTSTSLSYASGEDGGTLSIVTPSLSAAQRVQAANDRWFSGGTFTHVKKGGNLPGQ